MILTEQDVRRVMRSADVVPVRPVEPHLLRTGLRRPRPALAAFAGVAAVAATVAAVAVVTGRAHEPALPTAAERCTNVPTRPSGPADVMLTPGPSSLVVCHHPGNSPVDVIDVAVRVPASDPRVGAFVAMVNALPLRTGYQCMVDDYEAYIVWAEYRDDHVEQLRVSLHGCRGVTNGTRRTQFPTMDVVGAVRALLT